MFARKDILRLLVVIPLTMFWSSIAAFGMILAFLKSPFKFFWYQQRLVPPKCLMSGWQHGYLNLPGRGVKLHYVQAGDADKPLMLFLHGFPEFWYSWRSQLREFSKDYRAVAIDMRGYGDSDKPAGISAYVTTELVADVVAVIKTLGYSKCVLVAHDWGGRVAWNVVLDHPEVVDKLVVMNCSHPVAMDNFMFTHLAQLLKSWYVFFFQCPWLPEIFFRANDFQIFDKRLRKGTRNPHAYSDEDIETYKYTFGKPGAQTPPINYYRARFQRSVPEPKFTVVDRPTLIIWGTADQAIDTRVAALSRDLCRNGVLKLIEGASHWVQQDEPALVNQYMRQFLGAA